MRTASEMPEVGPHPSACVWTDHARRYNWTPAGRYDHPQPYFRLGAFHYHTSLREGKGKDFGYGRWPNDPGRAETQHRNCGGRRRRCEQSRATVRPSMQPPCIRLAWRNACSRSARIRRSQKKTAQQGVDLRDVKGLTDDGVGLGLAVGERSGRGDDHHGWG